jgi:hypothetical protein
VCWGRMRRVCPAGTTETKNRHLDTTRHAENLFLSDLLLTQLSVLIEFAFERMSLGRDPSFLGQKNTLMKLLVRSMA